MSMVQQIIQAVTASERQIDEQVNRLTSYNEKISQTMQQVQSQLGGSTQSYDQKMLQQLQQTKKQLDDTIQMLRNAKEKLTRVRAI